MPQIACLFCHHRNPAGSRFCNDCGSPMHLRGCPMCDAVDKREATHCYQCGAALSQPPAEEADGAPIAAPSQVSPTSPAPSSMRADLLPHRNVRSRHARLVLACGVVAFGLLAAGLDYLGRSSTQAESLEHAAPAANAVGKDTPANAPNVAEGPAADAAPAPRADAATRGARSAKGAGTTAKGARGTRRTPEANKKR